MIKLRNIEKSHKTKAGFTYVLRQINLDIAQGEFITIMGPSGAGKSTLLGIVGLYDHAWEGEYELTGYPVHKLAGKERAVLNKRFVGFVFQQFHLLDDLTVAENLDIPLSYRNIPKSEREATVADVLDRFNIVGKKDLFPSQLSGGQQQLVAVARAIIANPKLLLADEPTGNLHSDQGREIMELFKKLNNEGVTIIQVTHSETNAAYGHRIIRLKDGWMEKELTKMDIARPDISIKKRRRRRLIAAVLVVALTAVTVVLARLKPAVPSIEKTTISWDVVKRGEMLREVRGNGTLVPVDIRWIPAASSGRIEKILVEPGESVEPDTVLIELSDPISEQDAVSAKAQFNAEEANLENLRVQVESERLTQQAAVASAESNYKQAKLDFDVNEKLGQSGLVAELVVNQSKAKAEELEKLFEIETERMEMTPRSAKAQLAAQEAKVEQLRTEYERKHQQVELLKVRAGIKGVVQKLGDDLQVGQGSSGGMTLQSGQQIVAGANLARISDPTRLKAQIKIAETQVRDVARGQTVAIDTRNGIIPGHVTRVAPAAENGVVNVDVALDGPLPRGTRPDQSVDGTIELERLENVLYVGRPVNGQPDSKVSLFKVIDGGSGAARVPVKLGRSSVSSIEILEGLNAGDQVALSDMSTYDNQDNLRLY